MNINQKKNEIQLQALKSHEDFGGYSTLALCTGAGKSRCAVLKAIDVVAKNPEAKIFLAVPTTKLRDENWKAEFAEWGGSHVFENNLIKSCYVSMHKYTNEVWDFVIMDEAHHITPACFPFFTDSDIKSILGLTATYPKDKIKKGILDTLCPISFDYPLSKGLEDGIVAPFSVDVIWTDLDTVQNVVEAGPKAKRFKTTEAKSYMFWDLAFEDNKEKVRVIKDILYGYGFNDEAYEEFKKKNPKGDFSYHMSKDPVKQKEIRSTLGKYAGLMGSRFRIIGARKSILQNSINKERIARRFRDELFNEVNRYLVFCGGIPQAERLFAGKTFHSSTDSKAYSRFLIEELNILGVVNAVNEGTNIPNLDEALIIQVSAQELHLIQRVGRVIRIRDNHTGKIYILCVKGTQDEVWLKSALKGLKNIVITFWSEKDFFDQFKNDSLAN